MAYFLDLPVNTIFSQIPRD